MLTYVVSGWRQMSPYRKVRRVLMLSLLALGVWALTPYFLTRQANESFPASAGLSAEPRPVAGGSFTRVDAIHVGEGTATIYRAPNGDQVLRLDAFKVTNGPALVVSLSGHPAPRNPLEVHGQGYRELQPLKANEGSQNYELPPDLDLAAFRSVVIYCKSFHVVFSTAELAEVS